jgi:hypothetical protein
MRRRTIRTLIRKLTARRNAGNVTPQQYANRRRALETAAAIRRELKGKRA